jgi:hypothetical protein
LLSIPLRAVEQALVVASLRGVLAILKMLGQAPDCLGEHDFIICLMAEAPLIVFVRKERGAVKGGRTLQCVDTLVLAEALEKEYVGLDGTGL